MDLEIKIKNTKLRNPILLVGLPGIGLVGKIVVEYIINKTKAKKIGTLFGSIFPPVVMVNENNLLELVKDEIYLLKTEERDILLLTGDVQPYLNDTAAEQHYYFAKKIVDFAKKINVEKIYTFAGIDIGDTRITKKPELFFAANSKKEFNYLKELKLKPAEFGLTISGAAGMIIGLAKDAKIEGACLLAETSGKLIYGDFDSAKSVLKFIKKHFKIELDLKDIQKESRKITNAFKKVIEELKSLTKDQEEEKLNYIR